MDEEKLYISSKLYRGIPMNEHTFLAEVKRENVPLNHDNREGYMVTYPDGYVSWSPKEAFEIANREVTEAEKDLVW